MELCSVSDLCCLACFAGCQALAESLFPFVLRGHQNWPPPQYGEVQGWGARETHGACAGNPSPGERP